MLNRQHKRATVRQKYHHPQHIARKQLEGTTTFAASSCLAHAHSAKQAPELERGAVFRVRIGQGPISRRDAMAPLDACLWSNDAWKSYLGSPLCVSLGSSAWHPLAARRRQTRPKVERQHDFGWAVLEHGKSASC